MTKLSVLLLLSGVACGAASGSSSQAPLESSGSALVDSNAVMGFESPATWVAKEGTPSASAIRTQGNAAYALSFSQETTELVSSPVSSTATALAGIQDPSSMFSLDVRLPQDVGNPHNPALLDLFVSSPSRGLYHVWLGHVDFKGKRLGVYNTVSFPIPQPVRLALSGADFKDLTFRLKLTAPDNSCCNAWQKCTPRVFLFDNLRVHAPSIAPSGAGRSADLVAFLTYSPPQNAPGTASFPVGIVQVPQSFHVKLGESGNGQTKLELGYDGTANLICTYGGTPDGTSYILSSCTGGAQAGDLVGANFARLTIVSGDSSAGPTKIRAQLAINPVGDTAGAGVIPPMPTFWGDTPQSASQIVTDYFNEVNAAPKLGERWIHTPSPEFARRLGDPTPHNNLTGPPPPHDPPFDQESHLNPGSSWDAYWRLAGNLSADNSGNRNRTHFDSALSAHAVVWGDDIEVVSAQSTVDTDTGEVTANGFASPSASGTLHMFLFGLELPGGGDASPSTGFNFNFGDSKNFDLPPISIWIFEITLGVNASVGIQAQGTLSFEGFATNITPQVSVGAHLEGDVSIGIASGGVSAVIDLLSVKTPLNARAGWVVSTDPGVCNSSLSFLLDGQATISTLGGHVDLEATFGICPFCDHESWTLFDWSPLAETTYSLFHDEISGQAFPLPSSLCIVPLEVSIVQPTAGANVISQVPATLQGLADRPSTTGSSQLFPTPIDCSNLRWTSDNPSDVSLPAAGCLLQVAFGTPGPRTLTLTATDPFGEMGSASVSINVLPTPAGPQPFITSPVNNNEFEGGNVVQLAGGVVSGTGTPPYTFTWTVGSEVVPGTSSGTTTAASWQAPFVRGSNFNVTLTVQDATGATNSTSVGISVFTLF